MEDLKTHIQEAKKRVVRIIIVSIVSFFACFGYVDDLIEYLIKGSGLNIITVSAFETIQTELYTCFCLVMIVTVPYILYEVYKFVSPGLYQREKKIIKLGIVPLYICFLVGVIISLEWFSNSMLMVVTQYYIIGVNQTVTLSNYISFVISMSLAVGAMCCIPNIAGLLTYAGLINSKIMKKYRKHVIIVSLVLCAAITPGPDALSMVAMELPVIIIYEVSIAISKIIEAVK